MQHEAQQQPIEVLECNWTILQVFLRCEPTLSVGAASAVYTGMAAGEIVEVMALLRVPEPERVETFDGVRQMARVWCEARNAARTTA